MNTRTDQWLADINRIDAEVRKSRSQKPPQGFSSRDLAKKLGISYKEGCRRIGLLMDAGRVEFVCLESRPNRCGVNHAVPVYRIIPQKKD